MTAPCYATEAEFKEYPTGVNLENLPAGQLLRRLIGATRWLDVKTGMGPNGFGGGQAATRTFDGNGKARMMIPEAISISAVSVDAAVVPTTYWIAAPEEEWLPFNELSLYVPPGTSQATSTGFGLSFNKGIRNISITAIWGYSTTPDEVVKEAVILYASGRIKERSVRTFANSQAGAGGQTDLSGGSHDIKQAEKIAYMLMRSVPL